MANDLIKYGAIAVGGYFVLKYFGVDLLSFMTPATPVTVATVQGQSDPLAAVTNNTKQVLIAKMVADKADPNSYQTVDVWNYYYQLARGIAGPAPEVLFPNIDRNKMYSLDEWWTAITGQGFSGLGTIAHHVNPYHNLLGTQFGSNINPNGMEKYIYKLS